MVAVELDALGSQRGSGTIGQFGRGNQIDANADHHRIARTLHQDAGAFGAVDQQVVRPFELRVNTRSERGNGFGERDPGDERERRRRRIADRQVDDGRAHEIALPVIPAAPEPPAPGGLAIGDEPMTLTDMLAACQPRQQVGVGRTCLRDPLDGRYQNSTAAALAERIASTGMKR